MKRSDILAAVLFLLGGVWVGQGLGEIKGSFMTGDPFWAIVGAVLVGLAALLFVWPRRRVG